jgi:uncharacterized membrane protein
LLYFPTRPLAYFIIVSLYAGIILLQILYRRPGWTDNLIIVEILLLSLNLILGLSLKYPLYFGDTDILGHMRMIDSILNTGHINSFILDYRFYPLYHIFSAIGVEITGASIKTVLFIFMGIAWQGGIIFAYLIFRNLSHSSKYASIACLLFASSSTVIFYGGYAIARSLAFVFLLSWLYFIFNKSKKDVRYLLISFIFLAVLIMTHHLNVLYFIPVLIITYLIQVIINRFRHEGLVDSLFIFLLTVSAVSYLFWVAWPMARSNVPEVILSLAEMDTNLSADISSGYGINVIWGVIYYSWVLLLCILGMKIVFNNASSASKMRLILIVAVAGFFMLILYTPGPLDMLPFSDIMMTGRFQLIISPFVAVLMTLGIVFAVYMSVGRRVNILRSSLLTVLPVSIVVIMTFFSTIGTGNAQDNEALPHTSKMDTPYFENSELFSFSFLSTKGDNTLSIYSDYQVVRNFYSLGNFEDKRILESGVTEDISNSYLVLRIGELQRRQALTFAVEGSARGRYRYQIDSLNPDTDILANLVSNDRIYTSRAVQIYMMR